MQMTDEDVVARVAAIFGTKVMERKTDNPRWKNTYMVCVKGSKACEIMTTIRPLMGARRRGQIDRAILSFNPLYRYRNRALTGDQPREAKKLLAEGKTPREVADRLGVSYDVITSIKNGRSYKNA